MIRDRMIGKLKRRAREVEKQQQLSVYRRELDLIDELNRMTADDRHGAEEALLYVAEEMDEQGQ